MRKRILGVLIVFLLFSVRCLSDEEKTELHEDGQHNHNFGEAFEEYTNYDAGIIFSGVVNTETLAQIVLITFKYKYELTNCFYKRSEPALSMIENDLNEKDFNDARYSTSYHYNKSTIGAVKEFFDRHTSYTVSKCFKEYNESDAIFVLDNDSGISEKNKKLIYSFFKRMQTVTDVVNSLQVVIVERRERSETHFVGQWSNKKEDRICKLHLENQKEVYNIHFEDVHNLPSCLGYDGFRKIIKVNINKVGFPLLVCRSDEPYRYTNDKRHKFKFVEAGSHNEIMTLLMTDDCVLIHLSEVIVPCHARFEKRRLMHSGCSVELEEVHDTQFHQVRISMPNSGRIIVSTNLIYKTEICHGECIIPILNSREVLITCPNGYQHKLYLDDEIMSECKFRNWKYMWWIATFLCRGSQKPEMFVALVIWIIFGKVVLKLTILVIMFISYKINQITYKIKKDYDKDLKQCKHCENEIHDRTDAEDHLLCYKGRCPYCHVYKSLDDIKRHTKECPKLEKRLRDIESLLTDRERKEFWVSKKLRSLIEIRFVGNVTYILILLLFFILTVSPSNASEIKFNEDSQGDTFLFRKLFNETMDKIFDEVDLKENLKISLLSEYYDNFFGEFEKESNLCGVNCWNTMQDCNCPSLDYNHSVAEARMENLVYSKIKERLDELNKELSEIKSVEELNNIKIKELKKIMESEISNFDKKESLHEIVEFIMKLNSSNNTVNLDDELKPHSSRFKRHIGNIFKVDRILNPIRVYPEYKTIKGMNSNENLSRLKRQTTSNILKGNASEILITPYVSDDNQDTEVVLNKSSNLDLKQTKAEVDKSKVELIHQPNHFRMHSTNNDVEQLKQLPLLSQVERPWIVVPDNPQTGVVESVNNVNLEWTSYKENNTHVFIKGNAFGKLNLNPHTGIIWEVGNKDSDQKHQLSLYVYDYAQKYTCTRKFYTSNRATDMWFRGACTGDCVKNCACERSSCKFKIWDWDRGWGCNPTWCWNMHGGCSCCALDMMATVPEHVFSVEECKFDNYEYIICLHFNHDKVNCKLIRDNEQIKVDLITVTVSKPIGEVDKLSKQIVNYIKVDKHKTITLDHYDRTFINTEICTDDCKHGDIGDFQTNDLNTVMSSDNSLIYLEVNTNRISELKEKREKYYYSMNWLGIDFSHTCIPGRWPSCEYYGLIKDINNKFEFFLRNQRKIEQSFFVHSIKISEDLGGSEIYVRPKTHSGMIDFTISAKGLTLHKKDIKIEIDLFKIKKCSGCYSCNSGIECEVEIGLKNPKFTTIHFESDQTFLHVTNTIFSISSGGMNKLRVNMISIIDVNKIKLCVTEVKKCSEIKVQLKSPEVKIIDKNNYVQFKVSKKYGNECTGLDWFKCTWKNTKNFFSNIKDWILYAWENAKSIFILVVAILCVGVIGYFLWLIYKITCRKKRISRIDASEYLKKEEQKAVVEKRKQKGTKSV